MCCWPSMTQTNGASATLGMMSIVTQVGGVRGWVSSGKVGCCYLLGTQLAGLSALGLCDARLIGVLTGLVYKTAQKAKVIVSAAPVVIGLEPLVVEKLERKVGRGGTMSGEGGVAWSTDDKWEPWMGVVGVVLG